MRKALITGGNGDIAKAIADLLLNEGYEVFAPGRQEMDVTNYAQICEVMAKVRPDLLINNAGFIKVNNIADTNIALEKQSIDINLIGTFNCTNAVLKINPNAKIINIGSSAGTKVHGGWSAYCASKAAVIMATKCWAEENVDVICVSPGRTVSKMRKSLFPDEDQSTLLKAEDFAKIVIKAIHDEYPKGANIDVNIQNIKELLK